MHVVAIAAIEDGPVFEMSIACEIFGRHRPGFPEPWYELRVCAPSPVRVGGLFVPDNPYGYDVLERAGTVIVPALGDGHVVPAELAASIRAAHANGARIVSLCTGAFALAAAGILDGRPATTHWFYAEEFRRRYPAVRLDPDVLYIDDGDVLTSAGTTAGIDLCLHLVRADHGSAVATMLARRLVAPAHRDGGQAQYIESPQAPDDDDGLAPLLDWMRANLDKPIGVGTLAGRIDLAERTFIRRFRAVTGTTPIKWLTAQRVLRARELLETGTLPIDRIAEATGLGNPANFRRHFTAAVGVAPSVYRRTFR